jgi:hypothetical protein
MPAAITTPVHPDAATGRRLPDAVLGWLGVHREQLIEPMKRN